MKKLKPVSRKTLLLFAMSTVITAAAPASSVSAQQVQKVRADLPATPPSQPFVVTLSLQESTVFQASIRAIALQGYITIVAEDAPLHPRLHGKTDIPLTPLAAPELLTKVADAYDYDVSRVGAVYLLKKRYSDPADIPAVTPEECVLAMQDLIRILTPYDPAIGTVSNLSCSRMIKEFVATMTPNQMQAMQSTDAATGLTVASLGEQQRDIIHRLTASLYLGGISDELQPVLTYLSQVPFVTLRVMRVHQTFSRSYTDDGHTNSETWSQDAVLGFDASETPLTPGDDSALSLGFHAFGDKPPAPNDPTGPRVARPEPGSGADGYTTLAGVTAGLNARGGRFVVASPLRAKPISVYGVESVAPPDLFAALAAAYGLSVGTDEKARKVLTRALTVLPDGFADVPSAISAALPDSLRRAFHSGEIEQKQQEYMKAKQEAKTPTDLAALGAIRKQYTAIWFASKDRPTQIHLQAVSRLHDVVDAQLVARRTSERTELAHRMYTPAIKVSSLPVSAQSEFAVALLTKLFDYMNMIVGTKVPTWVADVDTEYLTGGPEPIPNMPGMVSYSISLSSPGENGILSTSSKAFTGPLKPIILTPDNQ